MSATIITALRSLPGVLQISRSSTALVALVSLFVLTRSITYVRSQLALRASGPGKTPPIVPYSIPYAANFFEFAWDTKSFLEKLLKFYGTNYPVRIRVLDRKIHFISGAENVLALFRGSRELTTVPASIFIIENAFGSPRSSRHIMEDDSGPLAQPVKGSKPIEPKNRTWAIGHKLFHTYLMGAPLEDLAQRFLSHFGDELEVLNAGLDEWVDVPDLYSLIKIASFRASTIAICGTKLFELSPNFTADFWEYDPCVPNLFKGLPRWMIPRSYRVRDRLTTAVRKWHAYAFENFDWEDQETLDKPWEENYGSKQIRERQLAYSKVTGMSKELSAALDLGMIWGANSNIIPTITWFLLDTLTQPGLLPRVNSEILSATTVDFDGNPQLNTSKLLQSPLLQSIYSEELRLRAGVMIQRVPTVPSFKIGSWLFPKDQMIIVSTWHEQRDRNVWNEGPVKGVMHSVDDFWAERFITYLDDPNSGPRKPDPSKKVKVSDDGEKEPFFSTESVTGSFLPYGGGLKMCPGRFYAKQEAICGIALLLSRYEIELVGDQEPPVANMEYFPFGVVPPKGKFPARMRKRRY